MPIRVLAKEDWQSYCNQVSQKLAGKRAFIEIGGLQLGNQLAARSMPLLGITYDPKSDLVEIALEGFDHLIRKPRSIAVDDGSDGLSSMEIIDADERHQIVRLETPLSLSPAGSH